jgi:hypothetical protein
LSRTSDGWWAVRVRPLPALTGLAVLVAGLGLSMMTRSDEARWRNDALLIDPLLTLAAVVVTTAVAIAWTRAFTAQVAALAAVVGCWVNEFDHGFGWHRDLPWSPFVTASAGLVVLAGSASMLAGFRAGGLNASTRLRRSLAEITTGTLPGRTLLAVGFGGIVMVLAAQGIRHSANDRFPLPSYVAIWLGVLLVAVLLLLPIGWRATSYLIPIVWVVAGLAAAPFAVGRLWSYWPAKHSNPYLNIDPRYVPLNPEYYRFDPESANLGAVAGCLLMVIGAGALLVLRVRRGGRTR